MQAIFGIIFHFTGGFTSGIFYIPYKRVGLGKFLDSRRHFSLVNCSPGKVDIPQTKDFDNFDFKKDRCGDVKRVENGKKD
ncbi:hypothetical protein [Mucilaginibacter aurantiaciroseus]|uniref:hypothetical protein n=1 Tax=Mucilaginibacter aurantiaciroseus TaxID=2949308 RepID=UPI0035138FCD